LGLIAFWSSAIAFIWLAFIARCINVLVPEFGALDRDFVKLESVVLTDFRSVLQVLTKIDEVYNLAGQSSVSLSFEQPVETLESITTGTLNLLEAIRFTGALIKLYNASSSESVLGIWAPE